MGLMMSVVGKGFSTAQLLDLLKGTLYKNFMDKEIKDFKDFHSAFLDMFNTLNAALPGMHYDVPQRVEVEKFFDEEWNTTNDDEKKTKFVEWILKNVNLSQVDKTTMMTGMVTPPVAIAMKRAGENVQQLRMIKVVPDVIFVPSATLLALVLVKLKRRISPPPLPLPTTTTTTTTTTPTPKETKK